MTILLQKFKVTSLLKNQMLLKSANCLPLKKFRPLIDQKIRNMSFTIETDSKGEVKIPKDCFYDSKLQGSIDVFKIGFQDWNIEQMPKEIIKALAIIKISCATCNKTDKKLDPLIADAIIQAAEEIYTEKINLKEEFPLVIWQTGSGTHTNMNVNEVIANRATEILGRKRGDKYVHPNDHVNKGQSSNDTFPTAMHIATVCLARKCLIPSLERLKEELLNKSKEFEKIIGAETLPLSLRVKFNTFYSQLNTSFNSFDFALKNRVNYLALGATAVGTGLNTKKNWDKEVIGLISSKLNFPFVPAKNKFEALATNDAMAEFSSALSEIACSLMKILNDLRFLTSEPRSGIVEYFDLKIANLTIEAVTMVCAQVMGNHAAVSIGASNGHLELNVYKPMIVANVLSSIQLLADSCDLFVKNCLKGIQIKKKM